MIQNLRTCQQKGHEQYNSNLVCTYKNCAETIKWVCQECLRKQIHLHGQKNHDHLINQQEFLEYLQQNNQTDLIEECQIQLSTLIKAMNKFLSHLNKNYEIKTIIEKVNEDFLSLSNEQIGIAQNKQKYDFKQINQNLQNIIQSAKVFEELIDVKKFSITVGQSKIKQIFKTQNHTQQINQQSFIKTDSSINSTINQNMLRRSLCNTIKVLNSNFEYQNYIQLVQQEKQIQYAQISQNEQYFAICQDNKLIIYHLEEKSQLKEINLEKDIKYCLFGQKSTIIYVGCSEGYIYSVELDDFYKLTQIHQDTRTFQYFVEKSSLKLLANNNKNIYEIDFKQQAIELKIEEAHQDMIIQIEFDRINKLIVGCSNDNKIRFYSEQGQLIIDHQYEEKENKMKQIQLINNNQQLLVLCIDGTLFLWQISLEKRQIILMEQFTSQQQTLSFNSVYNDKFIVTQSNSTIDIIDFKFNHIKKIYCSQNNQIQGILLIQYFFLDYLHVKQINSMNYLIILRSNQLTIMKQMKI